MTHENTGRKLRLMALAGLLGLSPAVFAAGEPAGKAALDLGCTFGEIDTNRDGKLSLEEFVAAGKDKDDLTFRAMDVDSDGSLSPEEYLKRQALETPRRGD